MTSTRAQITKTKVPITTTKAPTSTTQYTTKILHTQSTTATVQTTTAQVLTQSILATQQTVTSASITSSQQSSSWNPATENHLEQTIYNVITPSLLSDCAVQCLQDFMNICSRFLWESVAERCMLQSDNVTSDLSSQIIDRERSTLYFYSHQDCIVGYDYDRQTQTCIKMVLEYMNWYEARETCKEDGADLISISSLEKLNFVVNYCGDNCKNNGHWIGLYNNTWVTGESFTNTYDIPNDRIKLDTNDSCGRVRTYTQYKIIGSRSCSTSKPFVCEIQVI
ncbi:unnamed protein product [Mytilus edulis]|uniref:C-type lectin domain-containing protein n=1 Tax=Mytilus edulis TaxID=6550 RepID=A0A8S3SAX9_MYTED|nr:unnamed protein product [Mytilus edulis]